MTFKYFLIAMLSVFIVFVLALPRKAALRKSVIIAFVAVMLTFAVKPDWSTPLAHFVGIARGVDLLFYLSHLVMFFIAFMYYLKFKEIEQRFTRLVRQLALLSANNGATSVAERSPAP